MKLNVPALLPLLPLLSACSISISTDDLGDDEAESSESSTSQGDVGTESTTTTDDAESSTDSGSESASETTASETTADSTTTDSSSTDSDSTSTDSTGTDSTGTDSTETGGIEEPPPGFCGMSAGPVDPWFDLTQDNVPLSQSGEFAIECDGEGGSFLFRFDSELGGFMPAGKLVQFHVIMDVPGYNVGPNGHFAEKDFEIFIGCCPEDYYEYPVECLYDPKPFILSPPAIMNPSVLDGLPATLTVTMHSPEGDVEEVIDVDIWAMQQVDWQYCGVYDYQPFDIAMPIPIG